MKRLKHPIEFELLIQEILYILDSERDAKYYPDEKRQEEHKIEEKFTLYDLNQTKIKVFENLPKILQFTRDLINILKIKYDKFPVGYHYYKDVIKRMTEYVEVLEPNIQDNSKF